MSEQQEEQILCATCGVVCSADDAYADDSGLAWCGAFRGNGCAELRLEEERTGERPALCWEIPYDGNSRVYQMTFGYFNGEETAAVVHDDGVVLIPRAVLGIAHLQGW